MEGLIDLTVDAEAPPLLKRPRETSAGEAKATNSSPYIPARTNASPLSPPAPAAMASAAAVDRSAEILACVKEIKARIEATPHVEAVPESAPVAEAAAQSKDSAQDPAPAELLAEVARLTTQVSTVADLLGQHIERIERKLQGFDERIGGMEKAIYEIQSNHPPR